MISADARLAPMHGNPSGKLGRCPIQTVTRSAGMSRGNPGKACSSRSRSTAARRQSGTASNPAISTCPAHRSPPAVIVIAIFPSDGITGTRGPTSGSRTTA